MPVFRVHFCARDGASLPPSLVDAPTPKAATETALRRHPGQIVAKVKRDRSPAPASGQNAGRAA